MPTPYAPRTLWCRFSSMLPAYEFYHAPCSPISTLWAALVVASGCTFGVLASVSGRDARLLKSLKKVAKAAIIASPGGESNLRLENLVTLCRGFPKMSKSICRGTGFGALIIPRTMWYDAYTVCPTHSVVSFPPDDSSTQIIPRTWWYNSGCPEHTDYTTHRVV